MSDSDSDVPLALLAAKKKKAAAAAAAAAPPADDPEEDESSEEEEFDDGDDDDDDDFEEDGDGDEEEEEEEIDAKYYSSDSSDDVPLSQLKSPKKKKAAAKSPAKKKAASSAAKKAPAKKTTKAKTKTDTKVKKKKTTAAAKKKKSASSGKKSPVPSSSSSSSRPNLPSFALYDNELDKGLLIQRFLCRWWYAVEWPDPATLPTSPPSGYDALNGFPGVYICTRGASIGKIVDRRDKSTAPSFANYARKSSEELQGLLLKALAGQKAQLIEAEGPGTATEKELDKMEKWTRKLNCKKLDRDAATALKAAGISLD